LQALCVFVFTEDYLHDDVLGQQKPRTRGDPDYRARHAAAAGRRRFELLCGCRLLGREHDGVVRYAAAPELAAHYARKSAAARLGNVAYLEQRRVKLVSRAERGDDGYAAAKRRFDEVDLASDEVYCVDYIVIVRAEELLARFGLIPRAAWVYPRIRRYVGDAPGHDEGLFLTDCRAQRGELAIYICF
jgi:hypothetical protein